MSEDEVKRCRELLKALQPIPGCAYPPGGKAALKAKADALKALLDERDRLERERDTERAFLDWLDNSEAYVFQTYTAGAKRSQRAVRWTVEVADESEDCEVKGDTVRDALVAALRLDEQVRKSLGDAAWLDAALDPPAGEEGG